MLYNDLKKYFKENRNENPRIIIREHENTGLVKPLYINIRRRTVEKLKKDLGLKTLPGYKESEAYLGSTLYLFEEFVSNY